MKSDFRCDSFKGKFSLFLFDHDLTIACSKKIEKIIPKTLLNRGIIKPELNFNPGLTLISLRTTGTCRRISDEIWGFSSFSVTCALQKKNFVLSALFGGKLISYTHGLTSFLLV